MTSKTVNDYIHERSYIWTVEKNEFMIDHPSYTHNLSICKIKEVMSLIPVQVSIFFRL